MKKQFKVISLIAILALVISFGLIGCARNPARPNTQNDNQLNRNMNFAGDGTDMNRNMGTGLNNRNLTDNILDRTPNQTAPNRTLTNNRGTDPADKIANKIEELDEIKNVAVAISGNRCLVGVTTTDNVEGNVTTTLKNRIENIVKESDNNIKTVHVTASPDLYSRIENIGNGIREGRPLSGFASEIEEIIRRITPTTR